MSGRLVLVIALAGVAITAILLTVFACPTAPPPHPAIGTWRSGFLSLIVYPDQIALQQLLFIHLRSVAVIQAHVQRHSTSSSWGTTRAGFPVRGLTSAPHPSFAASRSFRKLRFRL